jgi:probable F420-dependent oxidoreductase
MSGSISFAVQASLEDDPATFAKLARGAESMGFSAIVVADHPGVSASPFESLTLAATATTSIGLGTYVLNTGVRDPLQIACDAITVDVVSGGRLTLGLGAGHTPAEWQMSGRLIPSPKARVARLGEMVFVLRRLLAGERVSFKGQEITLVDAEISSPKPFRTRIPFLIGGNGRELLRMAASEADIVSITGFGKTLTDGHHHEAQWSGESIDDKFGLVAASSAGRQVILDALVQHVEITEHRLNAAERIARRLTGATAKEILECPFVLIGSNDEIVEEIMNHRDRWGITSYVVRADAVEAIAPIVARLRG